MKTVTGDISLGNELLHPCLANENTPKEAKFDLVRAESK